MSPRTTTDDRPFYLTPDFLESQRGVADDNKIADFIARKDANFARKLDRARADSHRFSDPQAVVTGLLNHTVHGDASFKSETGGFSSESSLEGGFTQQEIADSSFAGAAGKTLANFGIGLGRTAKDIASIPFTSEEGELSANVPKNVAQAGKNIVTSAASFAAGAGETAFEKVTGKQVPEFGADGTVTPVEDTQNQEVFQAGVNFLQENFGGADEIVRTLVENPARVFNSLLAFTKANPKAGADKVARGALTKSDEALTASARAKQLAQKDAFVEELITPKQTTQVKLEQVPRTAEKGKVIKKQKVELTKQQQASKAEVMKIEGISKNNTHQKNYNLIQETNRGEALALEQALMKDDFIYPKKEALARLDDVQASLENHPLIVGDAAKTADRLIAKFKELIENNPSKGSAGLKIRKEYDKWVRKQKPKAFDANTENAFTVANNELRTAFNDFLIEKSPRVDIKTSLQRQHSLFNAMDDIQVKAAEESIKMSGRIVQKLEKVLGARSRVQQALGLALGIGTLAVAQIFAKPFIIGAGAGYLVFKGGKLVVSPQARLAAARMLREIERVSRLDQVKGTKLAPLIEPLTELSEGRSPTPLPEE